MLAMDGPDAFIVKINQAVEFYPADPDDPNSFPTISVAGASVSIGVERDPNGNGYRFRLIYDLNDVYACDAEFDGVFTDANGTAHLAMTNEGNLDLAFDKD